MSDKFTVDAWWASAKVIFIEGDGLYQIENNYSCALGVGSKSGNQFFLCQKIVTQDGAEYILERYDFEKQTLFYRRRKNNGN